MSKAAVSDDVRRFVLTSVPSVPYLEALLLLRAEQGRSWDSFGVASRLYVGEGQAEELLQMLHAAGVARLDPDGRYTYHPATGELQRTLEELAATYAHNLVGVTDLIHSRVDKRAQQFAAAFRIRKDGN
jgi:Mn-dependent DtxR family transcriptional regulator